MWLSNPEVIELGITLAGITPGRSSHTLLTRYIWEYW